jgi:hypothetical protein
MSEEDPDSPKLPKLLSVSGLMAVAILGTRGFVTRRDGPTLFPEKS